MIESKQGNSEDYIAIAAETIAGDLRDFVLDRLKHDHSSVPWNLRPEADQRGMALAVEQACRTATHKACTMIAAGGHPAAGAMIAKLQVKDGLQLQVNVAASEKLRHEIMDHVGRRVLLVFADPDEHMGERSAVRIRPDQGGLLDDAAA